MKNKPAYKFISALLLASVMLFQMGCGTEEQTIEYDVTNLTKSDDNFDIKIGVGNISSCLFCIQLYVYNRTNTDIYYEPSKTVLLSKEALVIHQLTPSEATQLVSNEITMDRQNIYSLIDSYSLKANYIPSGAGITGKLFYPLNFIQLPVVLRVEINGLRYSFQINRAIKEEK